MELQWYHGREVTEQERKAITEALGDYAYALNDEDIQRWIDDSTITLNGQLKRNGKRGNRKTTAITTAINSRAVHTALIPRAVVLTYPARRGIMIL